MKKEESTFSIYYISGISQEEMLKKVGGKVETAADRTRTLTTVTISPTTHFFSLLLCRIK
jgi:hypothetical protein